MSALLNTPSLKFLMVCREVPFSVWKSRGLLEANEVLSSFQASCIAAAQMRFPALVVKALKVETVWPYMQDMMDLMETSILIIFCHHQSGI